VRINRIGCGIQVLSECLILGNVPLVRWIGVEGED